MPFVRGVADFTRLRVDRPAEELTLLFKTIPSRFEVGTSVLFSVVSPPDNTTKRRVRFLLEGNPETLSSDKQAILDAISFELSIRLDVDISRIGDLVFTVSNSTLS